MSLLDEHIHKAVNGSMRKMRQASVRPHLLTANIGEITQGTVFSCIRAPRYVGARTYGLVITARCDIAQDKYPVLNYVPVVPLSSWLRLDGLRILVASEKRNFSGKIKSILSQAKIAESILLSVSLEEIARSQFSFDASKKADRERAKKFTTLIEDSTSFDTLVQSGDTEATFRWFAMNRRNDVENIISRLSRHDVAGYYFFEKLLNEENSESYVCLLRDVASIPRGLAIQISNGLSLHVLRSQNDEFSTGILDISDDDLAMPVSCVGSPTIEHLMQTFSGLFGRIGLDDPDKDILGRIMDRCCAN